MYRGKRIGMVVPAAGIGSRMGAAVKKQYLMLKDREILRWTLESLLADKTVDELIVVVGKEEAANVEQKITEQWFNLENRIRVIVGGDNRQASVFNGLKTLESVDYVLIHDGVRPFVQLKWVKLLLDELMEESGLAGVSVGTPTTDTLKKIDLNGKIVETVDRSVIWAVQTPQGFSYDTIIRAHEIACKRGFVGTDDTAVVEAVKGQVKLLDVKSPNLKITTPLDLAIAEQLLREKQNLDRTGCSGHAVKVNRQEVKS